MINAREILDEFMSGVGKLAEMDGPFIDKFMALDGAAGGDALPAKTKELIALGVYGFQIAFSTLWMKHFRFGPVEWVWRMLTYGEVLPLRREKRNQI